MADTDVKSSLPSTKTPSPDNAGPIIEESQESEEYQENLQVVLGTAFGVITIVGLFLLGILLYRIYLARSGTLSSNNQNDNLNLFERDLSLDVAVKSDGYPSQPTVFMLYAQDCPIHERVVAALASFLMEACGCVVSLDILEEAELAHRGLDDWLIERLQEADYILTVCSLGARLRCSKKHLRFKKWTTPLVTGNGKYGNESLSSSPTLKKLKVDDRKRAGFETTLRGDNKRPQESGDGNSKGESDNTENIMTSLSGSIADYFAVAVDYVAEKMRVEQHKGLGLRKFLNVYFDYSARSDIPPQLEMAAQFCLMRDLKQLLQHLMGSSQPSTFQNHNNEREEEITIDTVGDGSEKSEEGEGSPSGFPSQPCDILETETGMLLLATLEQAKAFFQDNPTWMEEQMDRACSSPPPPSFSQPVSHLSPRFSKRGRDKRWRKKRRRRDPGLQIESRDRLDTVLNPGESVKEPLLGRHCEGPQRERDGGSFFSDLSSTLSPTTALHKKTEADRFGSTASWSRDGIHADTEQYWRNKGGLRHEHEHAGTEMRNTLPRSGKDGGNTCATDVGLEGLAGWVSNERPRGFGLDSPVPHGVFFSRQNSLPSSLASSRTPEVTAAVIDTDGTLSAAPSPSALHPTSKLSCISKSADSFATSRDLREWHPMDQERLPCLYCNGTQLDQGCARCRPGHLGNRKGVPDCDIEPGFSSSAEGVPVLLHSSCKNSSKSQTVLQAEVHQEWRAGLGLYSAKQVPDSSSPNAVSRVWDSGRNLSQGDYRVSVEQSSAPAEQLETKLQHVPNLPSDSYRKCRGHDLLASERLGHMTAKGDNSPMMRRWVSGIVQSSPKHWATAEDYKMYSGSLRQPATLQYQHHHRTLSGASSLSSHEDSASVSSADSVSDGGDSLERDLRSIEKISSFHDFVVSSSFMGGHGTVSSCSKSFPSRLPPLTLFAHSLTSPSDHRRPENV
ncbi:interleukin-17 receptor D [Elysia marginata]|uniref:Interleukin-17 receptor D n=1 Tax=Elysia marginata TaxID=1093978 RepID=A0AAV4IK71_9GAST|nr:interleukin-17 receptor D [Elysia marginata]